MVVRSGRILIWESCVPQFARLTFWAVLWQVWRNGRERNGRFYRVGLVWVLILCAWCFVRLSTALSSAFGRVGAEKGLRILHVNVLVFAHVGGFKGCISRSQVVVHFVGHGIAWIWNWRCFWGRLPLLEPWGFPCRPVFLKFGFEHWPHVIWHIQLNSCHVLVVGVHGA